MNKNVYFILKEETEFTCSNCNHSKLSILSLKSGDLGFTKNDKDDDHPFSKFYVPDDEIDYSTIYYCQLCNSKFQQESELVLDEKAYREMYPEADDFEVEKYLQSTKHMSANKVSEHTLDINIIIDSGDKRLN